MSTDTVFNRVGAIPLVLRIACLASGVLGLLQVVAPILPAVSPGIEGVVLRSPILATAMGRIHLALAWAIFRRMAWAIWVLLLLPVIQYGFLYLETGIPEQARLQLNVLFSGVWALFFGVYLFGFKAIRYFRAAKHA
ncbi:MAG: hypothetical protein R3175_15125 [Marinobacter sp.]|uniref:hypothetical protein n=1 Tax=Marinobacter sp. TaxID=50741 RepID=UPI00299CF865|nr:hypothetical protein [Marinobacter sp.]MDX1757387.1 hypothetical protein [Marinobacter sp.]